MAMTNSTVLKKDDVLWHMRLGHASYTVINHIDDIKVSNDVNQSCSICPLAKQSKLPFQNSSSYAKNIFDLMHVHLWGPYHVSTSHGYKYFLTIVDDHSRIT